VTANGDTEPSEEGTTLYEAVGGLPFFERLVDAFYDGVMPDPVLGPLYPPDDIDGAKRRLSLFLAQYWGGPHTYMDERGHPMLRMRHAPFRIGATERDHWLLHMAAAVEQCTPPGEIRDMLMGYFVPAADHLRNDGALRMVPPQA
jgi:hemoglobin